jgi:serine/threonine protein kinase
MVGDTAKIVLKIPNEDVTVDNNNNVCDEGFGDGGNLLIIAIPYKEGHHVATKPTDFIPVMDQLQKLHQHGYAHGDIRAFNVVFCGDSKSAFLIDFDFSGNPGKAYPRGYRQQLIDGSRIGIYGSSNEGASTPVDEDSKLAFWHDWYALGQLIFTIFELGPPPGDQHDAGLVSTALLCNAKAWRNLTTTPSDDDIKKLKSLLVELATQNWTVTPRLAFQKELNVNKPEYETQIGATGSPPKK